MPLPLKRIQQHSRSPTRASSTRLICPSGHVKRFEPEAHRGDREGRRRPHRQAGRPASPRERYATTGGDPVGARSPTCQVANSAPLPRRTGRRGERRVDERQLRGAEQLFQRVERSPAGSAQRCRHPGERPCTSASSSTAGTRGRAGCIASATASRNSATRPPTERLAVDRPLIFGPGLVVFADHDVKPEQPWTAWPWPGDLIYHVLSQATQSRQNSLPSTSCITRHDSLTPSATQ